MSDDPRKILAVIKGVPYESVVNLSPEEANREIDILRYGVPLASKTEDEPSFSSIVNKAAFACFRSFVGCAGIQWVIFGFDSLSSPDPLVQTFFAMFISTDLWGIAITSVPQRLKSNPFISVALSGAITLLTFLPIGYFLGFEFYLKISFAAAIVWWTIDAISIYHRRYTKLRSGDSRNESCGSALPKSTTD